MKRVEFVADPMMLYLNKTELIALAVVCTVVIAVTVVLAAREIKRRGDKHDAE